MVRNRKGKEREAPAIERTTKPQPQLTIVIPTLNSAINLASCLKSLAPGRASGLICDVIMSDGGSEDETTGIASDLGAVVVSGPPGRGGQLRRGADRAAASGSAWFLFLHADSVLTDDWTTEVASQMSSGGPAAFRLRFRNAGIRGRLVAGWANLRSRVFGLPYGDQGLLVSRNDYTAAGGFDDIPLMEDVALVRRLPDIRLLQTTISTGAERYLREGWFLRGSRNLVLLTRYFLGADPEALAKSYRSK